MKRVSILVFAFFVVGSVASLHAGVILLDNSFEVFQRPLGIAPFALTADDNGAVYYVTSTSGSGDLQRVNADGSIDILNANVGGVIGTVADLEIGFGGDIFANSTGAIRRFAIPGGAGSVFASSTSFGSDDALAFDPATGTLYASGITNELFALDSAGNISTVVSGVGDPRGLALEQGGTLLAIGSQGPLRRIDPVAMTSTLVADLSTMVPDWNFFLSMDVHPVTGDVYFSVRVGNPGGQRDLYRIASDGTGLTKIVSHNPAMGFNGPQNLKIGASGDGSGNYSIYFGHQEGLEVFELRPIPEPTSLTLMIIAAAGFFLTVRRYRSA